MGKDRYGLRPSRCCARVLVARGRSLDRERERADGRGADARGHERSQGRERGFPGSSRSLRNKLARIISPIRVWCTHSNHNNQPYLRLVPLEFVR